MPAKRLLDIAHSNSQRLVRLINDILDIEKIESGKVVFALQPVELRALAEQAIEANRGFAESFGVAVRLDPASAEAVVRVDPDRMTQVIINLLSNAVKFSPRGEEVAGHGREPRHHGAACGARPRPGRAGRLPRSASSRSSSRSMPPTPGRRAAPGSG